MLRPCLGMASSFARQQPVSACNSTRIDAVPRTCTYSTRLHGHGGAAALQPSPTNRLAGCSQGTRGQQYYTWGQQARRCSSSTTNSSSFSSSSSRPVSHAQHAWQEHSVAAHYAGSSAASMQALRTPPTLAGLQQRLGYTFHNPALLQQACTHSEDRSRPSYKELGFVGDAVLWALFAEHAFRCSIDTPRSGRWGIHMGKLLSRTSLAATARAWGLQQYLQLAAPGVQPPAGTLGPAHTSASSTRASSTADITSPHQLVGSSPRPPAAAAVAQGGGSLAQDLRRRAGRSAFWSTDELGEMFEGVVGALLLDSSYARVEQLLAPWVDTSYTVQVADLAAVSTAQGSPVPLPTALAAHGAGVKQEPGVQVLRDMLNPAIEVMHSSIPRKPSDTNLSQHGLLEQQEAALLQEVLHLMHKFRRSVVELVRDYWQHIRQERLHTQRGHMAQQIARQVGAGLQQQCGGCSLSPAQLQQVGLLVLEQMELRPSEEGQRLQYLGHALLRLCAAVYAYEEAQAADAAAAATTLASVSGVDSRMQVEEGTGHGASCEGWRGMPSLAADREHCYQLEEEEAAEEEEPQEPLAHASDPLSSICTVVSTITTTASSSSSSSSSSAGVTLPHTATDAISSDDDSCSTGSSGAPVSLVHQLNKRFTCLHSVRFRFRMALQLGLDPALWLPPTSPFMSAPRKQQRAALGRCLEVLAAALYLEQGMPALQAATGRLLAATPPIQLHKDWMPPWLNKN